MNRQLNVVIYHFAVRVNSFLCLNNLRHYIFSNSIIKWHINNTIVWHIPLFLCYGSNSLRGVEQHYETVQTALSRTAPHIYEIFCSFKTQMADTLNELCYLLLLVQHTVYNSLGTLFYLHQIGNGRVEQKRGTILFLGPGTCSS